MLEDGFPEPSREKRPAGESAVLTGAEKIIRGGRGHLGIIAEVHPDLWPSAGISRDMFDRILADLALRPISLSGQADPLNSHGMVHFAYAG